MKSQPAKGSIRILVVEDKWLLRHATRRLLEYEPDIHVVGTARNGTAALEKICTLQPDVVVTDLAMPDMGGLELAFLLRRRYPALGTVLVSAVSEPEIADLCALCGADVLITKALLPAKLPAVIRMVFSARQRSEERGGHGVTVAAFEEAPRKVPSGAFPQ